MKRLGLFVAGVLVLIVVTDLWRPTPKPPAPVAARPPEKKEKKTHATPIEIVSLPPIKFEKRPGKSEAPTDSPPPVEPKSKPTVARKTPASATNAPNGTATQLGDPVARVALAEVGLDPDADEYWLMAINNPNLSDHERQDLIEDLNEEGFDDPKNPTTDDLPLILSRIQLIEENAAFALDDVNQAAFAEAYKDLINMFAKVVGE